MKLILSIFLSLLSLNLFAADGALGTASGTTTVGTIPAGNLPALGVAYPNALTNNSTVAWTNTDNITALTFSGAGSGQGILSLSNAAATGLTVILGPSNAFANVAFFSNSIVAPHWKDPTNAPTSNDVVTATSTAGDTAWKVGGAAITPWTSDINGGGFQLTNSGNIITTNQIMGDVISTNTHSKYFHFYEDYLGGALAAFQLQHTFGAGVFANIATTDNQHLGQIDFQAVSGTTNGFDATVLTGMMLGGGNTTYETVIKIGNVSPGTDHYMADFGVGDSETSADYANGVWFRYSDQDNSGKWICYCSNNGSVTTNNTATTVTGNWTRLTWTCPANASAITYYVNGSPVATNSTANVPTNHTFGLIYKLSERATTSATRQIFVDYTEYTVYYTSPR